jgi:ABC-type multidrug transport system ATPase subunit
MRQRLGIAQALLNRPELLILDEPTSGFDPLGRLMVRDLLTELKTAGVSILLSSHILSEVEQVALPYSVREQLHRLRDREWKLQNLRHRIGYIE